MISVIDCDLLGIFLDLYSIDENTLLEVKIIMKANLSYGKNHLHQPKIQKNLITSYSGLMH